MTQEKEREREREREREMLVSSLVYYRSDFNSLPSHHVVNGCVAVRRCEM